MIHLWHIYARAALNKMKSVIGVLILCSVRVQLAVIPSVCDLMAIEYRFQCGEGFCDGPRQYCADDDVCRYCSIDLCRNPPDQCRYQCIKSQLQNLKGKSTTTQDTLNVRNLKFLKQRSLLYMNLNG